MKETPQAGGILTFDTFSLDVSRGCLLVDGVEVPLRPKTFALLSYLAANPGRLVSKDELIRAVWRGGMVSDDVLVQSVGELRRAMGDKGATIIRTVPRRGYRFEAEVAAAPASGPEAADSPEPVGVSAATPASSPQPRAVQRRWPLYATAFGLLVAVLSVSWKFSGWAGGSEAPGQELRVEHRMPAITVLPFANLGVEPNSVAGLQGMLSSALTRFSSVSVKPGGAGQHSDAQSAAAREHDVQYLIEGDVLQGSGRVFVNARLVSTQDKQLWSGEFDEEQLGKFAAEVVDAIWKSEQRLAAAKSTDKLDAYDYVQRARHEMHIANSSPEEWRTSVVKVRESATTATELDPTYAPAWTLLAESHLMKLVGGTEFPAQQVPKVENAAMRALALDGSDIRAHVVLAHLYLLTGRDGPAQQEADILQAINPNDPYGMVTRGHIMVYLGQTDAAIETLEHVRRVTLRIDNPGGWDVFSLALAYYLKGRYEDACHELGGQNDLPRPEAIPPLPDFVAAPAALLAACYAQQGQKENAWRAAELARTTDLALISRMQDFGSTLRNPADQRHLRVGLFKAGLLPSPEAPKAR
jgi:DNA-binding winged helix-turn-helix (wHTH) protein/TolB-like protein/predicted Zn-dependent protease